MKPLLSLHLVALCACTAPLSGAFPPPVFPARPAADEWPDLGAAVLDNVATLEYRIIQPDETEPPRLVAVIDHRLRIKILNKVGLSHATVRLPLDGFSTVTWVKGRSVHPDGTGASIGSASTRAVKRPGVPDGSDVRDLVFTIPNAKVGGLIEYRYERIYLDPDFVPVWVFGGSLPVVRAELGIVAPKQVKIDYRFGRGTELSNELPLRRRTADGRRERMVFVVTDVPAYYNEPNMPHLARVASWIAVVVTKAKVGSERRRLETWGHVAKRIEKLFERVGGRSGSGKATARFRKVRDALVPVDIPGLGVRQPVAGVGLSRGEPACTRDAAAYLLASLQGSSARVYPALLTGPSGPPALEDFPGLYPFVAAVVAVDVAEDIARDPTCREDPIKRGLLCTVPPDSYAFLDPLCSLCRYGELPTKLTGGRALVLHEEGPRWVAIPNDPAERNRTMNQLRLTLDVDGTVSGGLSGEVTGAPQRRLRAALKAAKRGEARDQALAMGLFGDDSVMKLKKATFANAKEVDQPLRFKSRLESRVEKLGYEKFGVRPVDVAGPAFPERFRRSRRYAALLEAPGWVETAVSLDLPVGYEVVVPPTIKLVEPFAEYAAGFARRDRTLSFSRRLVVKQHVISADQWPVFRRFLDKIEAYETHAVDVRVRDDEP